MYSPETTFSVYPFTRQPEGDEVVIGRIETGVFLAVPLEAVEALDCLASGKTIREVGDIFEQKYGERPDLDEFLDALEKKSLLKAVAPGEEPQLTGTTDVAPRVRYHFSNFPHRLAQRLFSKGVIGACIIVVTAALIAMTFEASLRPHPTDLYFPDHRAITWAILIGASYLTIFIHEFGHLIAARSLGINSRIGISNRLWYLVVETDLTGLWAVPKRQRYLPMLAGVLIDAVSGSLLVLLVFATEKHWISLGVVAARLARGMAFTYLMRIVWQCFLFVRTDFYFVIASLFNCRNLLKDTEGFLRNQLSRIFSFVRPVDQSAIPLAERRVIRAYSVLWLGGRLFAVFLLFAVTIPLAILYLRNLSLSFKVGFSSNPSDFIDALVAAAYFIIPTSLGLMFWMSGLVKRVRI